MRKQWLWTDYGLVWRTVKRIKKRKEKSKGIKKVSFVLHFALFYGDLKMGINWNYLEEFFVASKTISYSIKSSFNETFKNIYQTFNADVMLSFYLHMQISNLFKFLKNVEKIFTKHSRETKKNRTYVQTTSILKNMSKLMSMENFVFTFLGFQFVVETSCCQNFSGFIFWWSVLCNFVHEFFACIWSKKGFKWCSPCLIFSCKSPLPLTQQQKFKFYAIL